MNPISVYVHIPFCLSKCGYCAFNSRPLSSDREIVGYFEALTAEVEMRKEALGGLELATVYFGGGTPTVADPEAIGAIVARVKSACAAIATNVEITIEANPETVNREKLIAIRRAGINRLSLGIQSFDEIALRFFERGHSPSQAERAWQAARALGFDSVGIDLITGLPEPCRDVFRSDLAQTIHWRPEHISLYLLSVERPSRFWQRVKSGELPALNEDEQADIFLACHEILTTAGYEHYEISNYALPGFRSRHNSRYWNGGEYLGFGAGAHSYFGKQRWGNLADPDRYRTELQKGNPPVAFSETIIPEMEIRERIMLQLRTSNGLRPADFGDLAPIIERELTQSIENGWCRKVGDRFRPTPEGMLVADAIARDLWDALEPW